MVSLMFELFMVLLFGVKWVCCHFPFERCAEMELRQTCSSTSYFNVLFPYVCVRAVLSCWAKQSLLSDGCRGIFYPLHFVNMSSLATCTLR